MTSEILVSGTQNYQVVKASFCGQEWDGLTKTVHLSMGERNETLQMDEEEEGDAWTAFADLDYGTWEIYVSGDQTEDDVTVKRITTETRLLEVRREGDAGYDMVPSLVQ